MIVYLLYDDTVEAADFDSIEIFDEYEKAMSALIRWRDYADKMRLAHNYKISERRISR